MSRRTRTTEIARAVGSVVGAVESAVGAVGSVARRAGDLRRGRWPGDEGTGDVSTSVFVRGLAVGALVGAAIAGSTIWERRHARSRDTAR